MPIVVDIDVMLARRKMSVGELADRVNYRSPMADLDCLYGAGQIGSPYLYSRDDPAKLLLDPYAKATAGEIDWDRRHRLMRTHTAMHALTMSGAVKHLITCFLGDTYPTPRPNPLYRDLVRGTPFSCELWSLLSFTQRLMAGATGLPYAVTSSLVGSDLERGLTADAPDARPDTGAKYLRVGEPAPGERPFALVERLRPDLTLVHGACADRRGNIVLVPPAGEGPWAAYAAEQGVIATVERIVPDDFVDAHPERVVIPGQRVIALCEAPLGAHPQSLRGLATGDDSGDLAGYRDDYVFLTELVERLATEDGAKVWYRVWVVEPAGHAAYVRKLGAERRAELTLATQPLTPREPTAPPPLPATAEPVTRAERTVVLGARAIVERVTSGDYDTLLAGIGVSHLAAWLAAALLRERGIRVPVCAELGFYATDPEPGSKALAVDPVKKDRNHKRLRRIEGQVRGLQRMVEEDRYCTDVLTQIASAQEALRSVGRELMRNHLKHCAATAIRSGGADADAMYDELLDLMHKYNR